MSERIAEKSKTYSTCWKKCKDIFSLRISHNELTIALYLYCRDLLLFQFFRIMEKYKMADLSVPRNAEKLCSSNAKCTHRKENFGTYFPRQK